ncbi:MAG TPA: putative quinol monooxygenase [Solirubrobacteraceae bacterium]|nr:putative quinol monooxygenase [Solirubrobacteraceae bacterium]
MDVVVTVRYRAKPGEADTIRRIFHLMREASLDEPGCLAYEIHEAAEDQSVFFIYERYADMAAFRAHQESEHFQREVRGRAIALLDARQVERWMPLA